MNMNLEDRNNQILMELINNPQVTSKVLYERFDLSRSQLNYALKKINEVSPMPLVIHGGSGIPDEHIQRMVAFNVAKINIASDLRQSYIKSVGKAYEENNNEANLIKVLQNAEDAVFETVYAKILSMNAATVEV